MLASNKSKIMKTIKYNSKQEILIEAEKRGLPVVETLSAVSFRVWCGNIIHICKEFHIYRFE